MTGTLTIVRLRCRSALDPNPVAHPLVTLVGVGVVRLDTKAWRRVLKAAKLPSFRLYDLRHPFATQLLAQGAPDGAPEHGGAPRPF
jgi:integrase